MIKKLLLTLLFGILGVGVYGQTIKSLGYNTTNGQVVYSGTNTLTFTNRVYQSSTNATNVPEFRLTTKSNNVASWFVYDAVQTNPSAPNWAVAWYGLNTVPNATGTDRSRVNESIGAASFTVENMWVSPAPDPDAPLAEFYFNITDTNNLTTRGFSVIGNQTNSEVGFSDFRYPVTIYYNSNSRSWYGNDYLGLNVVSTNTGELASFTHSSTNPSATAQVYLKVQNNQTMWQAGLTYTLIRNFGAGRNAFRVETNGVIYGATGATTAPQAPVHLAGNTRIDGEISFNATTNADTTRTNLGLGWSALTNTNAANFRSAINAAPKSIFKLKDSDQSLTNNTNFVDVTDLSFDTEANKYYFVQLATILEQPAGTGSSFLFILLASNSSVIGHWDGISAGSFGVTPLTNAFTYAPSASTTRIPINTFVVVGGTNNGSVKLQFAQNSVTTNSNTIKANSWIKIDEIEPQ